MLAGMPPTPPAATIVSLTFDDGRASQDLARRLLADHGLPGTFYVNSGRLGGPGFLSWAQVDALAGAGHEVGGHTVNHPDLTKVSADEARREVAGDREELLARGYAVTTFAYPYGEGHTDDAVRAAVESAGYAVGRRAWGLHAPGRPDAETVPPGDPWAVKTPDGVRAETPLEALQAMVTAAERGGGWVPLVFHDVGDGWGDEWSVSPATFDALLGWLVERGTVVRTVAQVVG
jgi:peptidoglycan/xylan/chitin deacetylase (PgdA/CDA1 family)